MNAQFTRTFAVALVLILGAASASTAFAAVRGGPSGPSGPSNNGSTNGGRTIQLYTEVQDNCPNEVRCTNIYHKKPVIKFHTRCDTTFLHADGSEYKDCRREMDY